MNVRQPRSSAPSQTDRQAAGGRCPPPGAVRVRVGTVMVRRGAQGQAEAVPVPEGVSALHAGMAHLQQPPGLEADDDWYVVER